MYMLLRTDLCSGLMRRHDMDDMGTEVTRLSIGGGKGTGVSGRVAGSNKRGLGRRHTDWHWSVEVKTV